MFNKLAQAETAIAAIKKKITEKKDLKVNTNTTNINISTITAYQLFISLFGMLFDCWMCRQLHDKHMMIAMMVMLVMLTPQLHRQ
jgi:hypothetical protein